jgi:hypothetical protein
VTNEYFRHISQRHRRVNHAGLRRDPAHGAQSQQRMDEQRVVIPPTNGHCDLSANLGFTAQPGRTAPVDDGRRFAAV